MPVYNVTRIYADADGDSHFEKLDVPLKDAGDIGFLSEKQAVQSIVFRVVSEQYDYDFHTAPARQYIALMDGQIEIETSLGEKRIFSQGDVLLVEDTTGKGHKTRNLQTAVRKSLFVTLQ